MLSKLLPVALLCLLVSSGLASAQNPDAYIDSTYDRFRDQTRVQLLYPLLRDKELTISLFALGLYKGRKPTEPPPVVIIGMHFLAKKGEVNPQNKELLALADETPIDFGLARRLQIDGLKDDEKSAAYGALAPYADVRAFAEARKSEFRFFGVTGRLSAEARMALDVFTRKLRPE